MPPPGFANIPRILTHHRYKSLLISAAYTAVSPVVVLACSLIRTKALALWSSAAVVRAFGLLVQGTTFVSAVAGLGLSASAVKNLAAGRLRAKQARFLATQARGPDWGESRSGDANFQGQLQ